MEIHYTYLLKLEVDGEPFQYIGVRTAKFCNPEQDNYYGSAADPRVCRENCVEKKILKTFKTRKEASDHETFLQKRYEVDVNPEFLNKIISKGSDLGERSERQEIIWKHYRHFKKKVVYCPFDDFRKSRFWKYLRKKFNKLELKKLHATCYPAGIRATYDDFLKFRSWYLGEDGHFRSEECVELLKQSDLIVTEPPKEVFEEYVDHLSKYGKKYILKRKHKWTINL